MTDRGGQSGSDSLTTQQLETLLDARSKLLATAEQMARDAYAAMRRVAETLCAEQMDTLRSEGTEGIGVLDVDALADLVIDDVSRRLRRLESAAGGNVADLEKEMDELRAELARLRGAELARLQREQAPADQVSSPISAPAPNVRRGGKPPWRSSVKAAPALSRPAVNPETWPMWAKEWEASRANWTRDRDVILGAGSGLALMDDVGEILAGWWGVKARSGSVRRALARVEKAELIEIIRPQSTDGWRPRYLVQLTQQGREMYRLLHGEEPGESQAAKLIERHESGERAALALEAAEMLWLAGYEVELFPDAAARNAGGKYVPSLVVEREAGTLFVECVVMARAKRRWESYYEASGGHFCIVTPTESAASIVWQEIREWAGDRSLTLWMAELERGGTGDVWMVK